MILPNIKLNSLGPVCAAEPFLKVLWTNPGDTVLSPFTGIGSEGYVALQKGRRFVGAELKESYYKQAVKNLRSARKQQTLFDAAAP